MCFTHRYRPMKARGGSGKALKVLEPYCGHFLLVFANKIISKSQNWKNPARFCWILRSYIYIAPKLDNLLSNFRKEDFNLSENTIRNCNIKLSIEANDGWKSHRVCSGHRDWFEGICRRNLSKQRSLYLKHWRFCYTNCAPGYSGMGHLKNSLDWSPLVQEYYTFMILILKLIRELCIRKHRLRDTAAIVDNLT